MQQYIPNLDNCSYLRAIEHKYYNAQRQKPTRLKCPANSLFLTD